MTLLDVLHTTDTTRLKVYTTWQDKAVIIAKGFADEIDDKLSNFTKSMKVEYMSVIKANDGIYLNVLVKF